MGFSVSGSFAVLVVGAFIAFGMFHGAASNSVERVTDAQQDAFDDRLEQQNTAVNVTEASWNSTHLVLRVNNTGSTALSVNATDVIVDNDYVTHGEFEVEDVNGDAGTDLWLPGEEYHVVIPDSVLSDPGRIKVVVERGIADSRGVTSV